MFRYAVTELVRPSIAFCSHLTKSLESPKTTLNCYSVRQNWIDLFGRIQLRFLLNNFHIWLDYFSRLFIIFDSFNVTSESVLHNYRNKASFISFCSLLRDSNSNHFRLFLLWQTLLAFPFAPHPLLHNFNDCQHNNQLSRNLTRKSNAFSSTSSNNQKAPLETLQAFCRYSF